MMHFFSVGLFLFSMNYGQDLFISLFFFLFLVLIETLRLLDKSHCKNKLRASRIKF